MDLATFLIQCLNAVQYGLLLFLVARGLTLIFGIMGVINLAHGSFYMIGAYMAYALAPSVGRIFGGGFFIDARGRRRALGRCSATCSSGRSSASSTSATTCSRC